MAAGRKSKITEAVLRDLTSALSIGATVGIACAYAGVSSASYYNWFKQGGEALDRRDDDPDAEWSEMDEKCARFNRKMEEAKAYAAIGWLQVVSDAANHDANYALRMLKMRYPGEFVEVQRVEQSGPGGGPQETVVRVIGGFTAPDTAQ